MTGSPTSRKGAAPSGRAPSGAGTGYGASTGPPVGGVASGIGRTSGIRTPYGAVSPCRGHPRDGDPAAGLLLVRGEGRVGGDEVVPSRLTGSAAQNLDGDRHLPAAHLDAGRGRRAQVADPLRLLRLPARRRGEVVGATALDVRDRNRVRLPRAATGSREQQHGATAACPAADPSAGAPVDPGGGRVPRPPHASSHRAHAHPSLGPQAPDGPSQALRDGSRQPLPRSSTMRRALPMERSIEPGSRTSTRQVVPMWVLIECWRVRAISSAAPASRRVSGSTSTVSSTIRPGWVSTHWK